MPSEPPGGLQRHCVCLKLKEVLVPMARKAVAAAQKPKRVIEREPDEDDLDELNYLAGVARKD